MGRHRPIPVLVAWGLCVAAMTWPTSDALAKEINVPADAASIQAAINLSNQSTDASDTIHIATGTYIENLTISKPTAVAAKSLTIRANDGAKVVLQAAAPGSPLVQIGAGAVVTVERLILVTSGGRGVVMDAATASLRNLVITQASTAIECSVATSGNTVEQVTFSQVANGINCVSSTLTIRNNIFANLSGIPIAPFSPGSGATLPRFNLFFQSGTSGERGTNEVVARAGDDLDPQFVDVANNDFHIQEGSAAQGTGEGGVDVGAYGGPSSHTIPFPPSKPSISNCTTTPPLACKVTWAKNLDYLVTGYVVLSHATTTPTAPSSSDYGSPVPVDNATATCEVSNDTTCETTLSSLPNFTTTPASPVHLRASVGSGKVQLAWDRVSNSNLYQVFAELASPPPPPANPPPGSIPAMTVSVPRALIERLSDRTPLVNGTPYDFWVTSASRPMLYAVVEAAYGTVATTDKVSEQSVPADPNAYGATQVSGFSAPVTATPQPPDPFPRLEDTGGCFIATAAYGSAMAPQVDVLRAFREQYLRPYALGRAVIRQYELWSPPLADAIRGSERGRLMTRIVLWPVVGLAWLAVQWPLALILVLIVGAGGTLIWSVRGRMRRTTRA
ncbi:MAG TPA: CFI-box-CTERM domain-containing protein [Nitrospiria bacterium]|nr:CFI-box-CTERM domain-containing protein [Nitrospiria bacterium]